jgi:hypothetical protein
MSISKNARMIGFLNPDLVISTNAHIDSSTDRLIDTRINGVS